MNNYWSAKPTLAIDPSGFKSSEVFLTAEFTTQAAILSVLESSGFEDCIHRAVLDDGDTDTQAESMDDANRR